MICFAWSGFPQYGARCVGAFVKSTNEECVVIATRPKVPIEGMERLCGCRVFWIEANEEPDLKLMLGEMPRVLFVDGWGFHAFNVCRDQVRANGGKVFCMVDNNFIFSFKEVVKAVRFRFKFRGFYDGYFVPGESGVKLLGFYGVKRDMIRKGFYSADPSLFTSTKPILERPKRIIYVGQLCDRKNIVPFAEEFIRIPKEKRQGWELEICGCGPLKNELPVDQSIVVHDFVQPEALAGLYQNARVFALPSKEEHWGLVVHEAALSGCALLVSRQVGANDDFVAKGNGCVFDAFNRNSMSSAIKEVISWDDSRLKEAEKVSIEQSKNASLDKFVEGVNSLMEIS